MFSGHGVGANRGWQSIFPCGELPYRAYYVSLDVMLLAVGALSMQKVSLTRFVYVRDLGECAYMKEGERDI